MKGPESSIAIFVILAAWRAMAADVPKAPVPQSPFIRVVYGYADAMLKNGRDNYGPQKSGLFLSALDRFTMAPLTNLPPPPQGIRADERAGRSAGPLAGTNPQHDENFLRLLYTLSELSGKPIYRAAADAELKWSLEKPGTTKTDLLPWGPGLYWDGSNTGAHKWFRPWMLWDRCFEVAPDASKKLAPVIPQTDSLRQMGFYVRTWAVGYAHTKDEQFLHAIETFPSDKQAQASPASILSFAIDCDGAAHRVPEPLKSRLRTFAARQDELFCSLPHNVKENRGFLTTVSKSTQKSMSRYTPLWQARSDTLTTAQVGMMCVSRYDNTAGTAYRDLIFAAADAYLSTLPNETDDAWPMSFGHAISLELAAWRHSAKAVYLERARKLGEMAVEQFWGTNALPRASLKTAHYETITGADSLALALTELHLNILHITAVRCPPNTIDR